MTRFATMGGGSFAPSFGLRRLQPVTATLIGLNLFTFLGEFFTQRNLFAFLDFVPALAVTRPWSVLTYPFHAPPAILFLLLGGYLFWWIGSDLESRWGSLEYGLFFAAITVLGAVSYSAGALVVGGPVALSGFGVPLAAVFLAWCMLNPGATVLFMMVIPVQARWLGYIDLALLYFGTGPVLGLFALVAPLAAWFYAVRGRWFRQLADGIAMRGRIAHLDDYRPRPRRGPDISPFAWWKRRQRRKEVEDIVKRMGLEDGPRGNAASREDDVN